MFNASGKNIVVPSRSVSDRIVALQPKWMRSNVFRNLSGTALAVGSFTMMQLNEYFLAEAAMVISSGIFLAQISRISGWRSITFAASLLAIWTLFWVVDIYKMKGDKPWSNVAIASSNPFFHVVRGNGTFIQDYEPGWDGRKGFAWIGWDGDGFIIRRLSGLITLSITNTSEFPQTFIGISIDERSNRFFWKRLCYVDFTAGNLIFFNDSITGSIIDRNALLENSLLQKPLEAHKEVRGLVGIQCPESTACSVMNDLRITLISSSGIVYSQDLAQSDNAPTNLMAAYIKVNEHKDFSNSKFRTLPSCKP